MGAVINLLKRWLRSRRRPQPSSFTISLCATGNSTVAYKIDNVDLRCRADD